ncbi:MAG: hypothetical protein ABI763_07625, partial [Bacteroidota bacterium]
MNSKAYLAIYDEQRLFSDFIHNNLERFHQYDVLFSAPSEELLLASLTSEVKLLLIHIPIASDRLVELVKKVLRKFGDHKLLIYTPESEIMQTVLDHHSKKVKIVSSVFGSRDFFEALQEMMPDHQNHKISNTTKIYNQS